MNVRKLATCSVVSLLVFAALPLAAHERDDNDRPRTHLVVFGDSLSDPGNNFVAFHQVSRAPFDPIPDYPYLIGGLHYSNGETWVERLGHQLHAGISAESALRLPGIATNYAVGKARARGGAAEFPVYDLSSQVGLFLGQYGGHARSDALYVIWIGANDLKDALSSLYVDATFATAANIMQQAIGTTAANIQMLWGAGARHFLLVDMPNIALTPFVIGLGPQAQFAAGSLTTAYNGGLGQAAAALGALPGIDIRQFDVEAVLDNALLDAAANGIEDFDTPCLSFGVVVHAVCRHPDDFLFWDAIHPTAAGHALIAEAARELLSVH